MVAPPLPNFQDQIPERDHRPIMPLNQENGFYFCFLPSCLPLILPKPISDAVFCNVVKIAGLSQSFQMLSESLRWTQLSGEAANCLKDDTPF